MQRSFLTQASHSLKFLREYLSVPCLYKLSPFVLSYVAQALYGDIPGAVLTNISNLGEIWTLPCDQEVNATFLFGGVEFPVHPLDLNFDEVDLQENGPTVCVGAVNVIRLRISSRC